MQLEYFGEEFNSDNCTGCDNCAKKLQYELQDIYEEARVFVELIVDVEQGNSSGAFKNDLTVK